MILACVCHCKGSVAVGKMRQKWKKNILSPSLDWGWNDFLRNLIYSIRVSYRWWSLLHNILTLWKGDLVAQKAKWRNKRKHWEAKKRDRPTTTTTKKTVSVKVLNHSKLKKQVKKFHHYVVQDSSLWFLSLQLSENRGVIKRYYNTVHSFMILYMWLLLYNY